jgi:hypothetical protein
MSLVVGEPMLRVDDGMKGTVAMTEGGVVRIAYLDRGEVRYAGKGEKWEPVKPPPRKLRREEMMGIAIVADGALRSAELNEPWKWWSPPREDYDKGLIDVIVAYLEKRGA